MSSRLKKHLDLLKVIHTSSPALRKAIIGKASTDAIRCLCDCSNNVLNGNVELTDAQRRRLNKYKSQLRQLIDKKRSVGAKRKLLIQSGGGLPVALLGPIIAVVASLLAS